MIELNFIVEISLTVDVNDLVQVITSLAGAYRDFAAAQLMLSVSKALRK